MIDFYAARTPNARKIAIMLEECDARFQTHMIDIGKDEQFTPEFLRVNPNAKIPAIVDPDSPAPVTVFESAAILIYLGEKFGRLLPTGGAARATCISWTVWQVANVGPMFGQANHFTNVTTETCPYAIERFSREAARLVQVMEPGSGRSRTWRAPIPSPISRSIRGSESPSTRWRAPVPN